MDSGRPRARNITNCLLVDTCNSRRDKVGGELVNRKPKTNQGGKSNPKVNYRADISAGG